MLKNCALILSCLLVGSVPAFADLNFPTTSCSASADGSGALASCADYSYINQSYGDTANVNITYVDLKNPGNSLRYWDTGYNDLQGVAWGGNGDSSGQSSDRIEIAPTAGQSVTLSGFDLGAYLFTQRDSTVQIFDLTSNTLLVDYGVVSIGGGNVATHFAPNVTSTDGIAIEWKDSGYNNGIDNISFTTQATPEPGFYGILAIGLVGIVVAIRRKRVSAV